MATINNNTNLMSIRVSNLPDADPNTFYTDNNNTLVNSWFENNSYLLLCQAYSDDNESGNPLYYKSEKVKVIDLTNLVYEKYKNQMTSVFDGEFNGKFNGIFHHLSENVNYSDPTTYDIVNGSSSGYFTGKSDIKGGTIINTSVSNSTIDSECTLDHTKADSVKGIFTGSTDLSDVDLTHVTFYGKSLRSELADQSEKSGYATEAGYAALAKNVENFPSKVDEASHSDYSDRADFATEAGFASSAATATKADTAVVAESAAIADVAKYAQSVGTDSYPVGYCQYVKLSPGQGSVDVCDVNTDYDTVNNKWVKFKCYSTGYYTLTFAFTALRLSKDGSKGEAVAYSNGLDAKGRNQTSAVYYGDEVNKGNKKGQSIIPKLYSVESNSKGSLVSNSTSNTIGTVIQFQNINGAASDQFCPETVQCRNVIYNVLLEKDKEYILSNDFFPYRPDFMTPADDLYFPNEPAGGLFYKISSTPYGNQNNTIMSYTNYDNTNATNFSPYLGPVLEIRKVSEQLSTNITVS